MAESRNDTSELEQLQAAGIDILRNRRPSQPPLPVLLDPLLDWFETRHIERMRASAFADARRAFNPVFIHLPADGCRLTELAARAGMTKQAMAELVDEMIALGYLARFPDPADGRAKIIVRAERGLAAHATTMQAFTDIEAELAALIGKDNLERLRNALLRAGEAIAEEPPNE